MSMKKTALLSAMNEGSDSRREKAARYRAQAATYRNEANIPGSGLSKTDKLAFAAQWERLADELDAGKIAADLQWKAQTAFRSRK
jgi:hypothetical protein